MQSLPGTEPATALDNNKIFTNVWNVLRALRSHDDRLDAEINKIDLNNSSSDHIIFPSPGPYPGPLPIPFDFATIPPQDIYAKIVEKCGDRKYWESWAKDVADIFQRVVVRIENLLDNPDNDTLHEWFDAFHAELRETINTSITWNDAIDMMAQHILTRPVFEALFETYDFASGNPVSLALDNLQNEFGKFRLEDELQDLGKFYESVQMRARGIDNSKGRQSVLSELYEKFFKTAMKKEVERLGIVYTPVDVVDFILHSADDVLRKEFDRRLERTKVSMFSIRSPVPAPFSSACSNLTLSKRQILKGSTVRSCTRTSLFSLHTTSRRLISKKHTVGGVVKIPTTSHSAVSY